MSAIFVVGFMGAGKSTVGAALARRLGRKFIDLDQEIEAAEHAKISDIFEERGEREFRRIESEALARQLAADKSAVVALGGGAFTLPANREMLRGRGVTVWLDCPFDTVQRRVVQSGHRPLARDPQAFAALYEARRAAYSLADVRIPIQSDDPETTVDEVLSTHAF
jgi:shikimate kinase